MASLFLPRGKKEEGKKKYLSPSSIPKPPRPLQPRKKQKNDCIPPPGEGRGGGLRFREKGRSRSLRLSAANKGLRKKKEGWSNAPEYRLREGGIGIVPSMRERGKKKKEGGRGAGARLPPAVRRGRGRKVEPSAITKERRKGAGLQGLNRSLPVFHGVDEEK